MAGLNNFKCPSCGGTLEFNSAVQKMKCPYCDTEIEMDAVAEDSKEQDLRAQRKAENGETQIETGGGSFSAEEVSRMDTYTCAACGGEIVVPKGTGASACPFCGNAQVMPQTFSGKLKPDLIVPFKFDAKQVKEKYLKHLEGKKFLPAVFRDENHISEVKGVYVPFWLFSSTVDGRMVFRCENVRRWSDSNYRYVERKFYDVYRDGTMKFANVPVDGSSVMDDTLMESIEPFSPEDGVGYQDAYLSGYMAHTYDVTQDKCVDRATDRMRSTARDLLKDTVRGYDKVEVSDEDIEALRVRTKYVLFPVWLLNTTWNDQRFTFAMNGQTGKFVGNLPRDDAAFWKTFWIYTAICAVIFVGIAYMLAGTAAQG